MDVESTGKNKNACKVLEGNLTEGNRLEKWEPYIQKNSVALVRERTVPTERPPPVGEVSANFCG